MIQDSQISLKKISKLLNISYATVKRDVSKLTKEGKIVREGATNGGSWKVKA